MADEKAKIIIPKASKKGSTTLFKEEKKYSPAQIKEFLADVKSEFEKIAWPDKKHIFGSTIVVLFLVVMVSFYLGVVDLVLGKLISSILK